MSEYEGITFLDALNGLDVLHLKSILRNILKAFCFYSSINNAIDTESASQKHKSSLQGIGCIHRHRSQFKMSLSFLLLSDTKKSMFYVVQSRPKLDYTILN
jgi:hypothetical protein